jgi:hypothetical protein
MISDGRYGMLSTWGVGRLDGIAAVGLSPLSSVCLDLG